MTDFVHLRVRTEFSFNGAYGRVPDVLDRLQAVQTAPYAAITDPGTWGHPTWRAACETRSLTPLYGVEIGVVASPEDKDKQPAAKMIFLAKHQQGLAALYRLVALSGRQFHYAARLGYQDVARAVTADGNLIVLAGHGTRLDLLPPSSGVYLMLAPTSPEWNARIAKERMYAKVLTADPRYPCIDDKALYEVHAGRFRQTATVPLHLPTLDELRRLVPQADDEAILNTVRIAYEIGEHAVTLPSVGTVKFDQAQERIEDACHHGAMVRGISVESGPYADRLTRELGVIKDKGFADYFVLVSDLVAWAKQRMLVGPGRGSSAGSLVCYLLGITDVDPLVHGLLFERFIDITRSDWPDIDLDFPDRSRHEVFTYLAERYGERHVARLGSILRYKPDGVLNKVCFELNIPPWEIKPFKERIPPKPDGDTAYDAVLTALDTDSLGKTLAEKYPGLVAAAHLEGHANTSGTHAGGVVVADRPLDEVCGIGKDRVLMVDKVQAEQIGMLKVDVLGLLTLSVIDDCLTLIDQTRDWLLARPLDDPATYDVFKRERTAGIFQFDGKTQGGLVKQMAVERFADIVALGALSRPGPLDAGATKTYILRRMDKEPVRALHPVYDRITAETYGIVAYQEQMMALLREVGGFDWPTVSKLRKAINKKMGEDWFDQYRTAFVDGALGNGMAPEIAHRVWDTIITFGQYAFNKSHAVAYGLVSYWCAYLKAHHPLHFACAVLRNPKDDEAAVKMLRDLVTEGFVFRPVDLALSDATWSVVNGELLGGLTTVQGVGAAVAREILVSRANGVPLRAAVTKLFDPPVTPFDDLFAMQRRFGDLYANPVTHKITSGPLLHITDVDGPGTYVMLGRIVERQIREKEKYGRMQPYVKVRIADDTDDLWIRVNTREYPKLGRHFAEPPESEVLGKVVLVKGEIYDDVRILNVENYRWLDPKPALPKTP